MRRSQESQGFRRTGCTVGASSASSYGYSASDGTAYSGMGDKRNTQHVAYKPTPSAHHNNPGVVVNSPPQNKTGTVVTTTTVTYTTKSGGGDGRMFCGKCGARFEPGQRFCGVCGESAPGVEKRCPNVNCREHLKPGQNFCPACGTKCC